MVMSVRNRTGFSGGHGDGDNCGDSGASGVVIGGNDGNDGDDWGDDGVRW